MLSGRILHFFFFQAEDGIRDYKVTGVQTCALPISNPRGSLVAARIGRTWPMRMRQSGRRTGPSSACREIGRASCRERVGISVVTGLVKRKNGGFTCYGRIY